MGSLTKRALGRLLRKGGTWPEDRIDTVWAQFDQGTQRAILRLYRDAGEPRLAGLGGALDKLEMPALVIWGQRDPWLGLELGQGYAERLPRAGLERIGDGGHWPWLDRPAVVDRVAEFVNQG